MASKIQIKRSNVEGKVPLATDLDLGEFAINTFDGKVYLKKNDGTGDTVVDLTSSTAVDIEVKNETGATVPAGTVVYLDGNSGSKPRVILAQANVHLATPSTYGVVKYDIANNGTGLVTSFGTLGKLNTVMYSVGQALWLSATTAGAITTTKPTKPNTAVFIGTVTRAHATLGTIQVDLRPGYELKELQNVSLHNPLNEEVLAYESSSGLWRNRPVTAIIPPAGDVIAEMRHTITLNYAIKSGNNGLSISPVVVADGAAVTIPDGSRWIIYEFE